MLKLRNVLDSDLAKIDKIWRTQHEDEFSLPHRLDRLIDSLVVDDDDKIVAYGQVKIFPEATFLVDKDRTVRERSLALKMLLSHGFYGVNRAGLHEMYMFVKDPDFALLIEKHFKFHPIPQPGQLLIWEA